MALEDLQGEAARLEIGKDALLDHARGPVEWRAEPGPVPYPAAVERMEARVAQIRDASAREQVWLLEHPALYTAGTSARAIDLVNPLGLPVFKTGRGGQFTYHGPGQRIAYVMLDLRARGGDVRQFVVKLEQWIIAALAHLGVKGETRGDRIGVWVARADKGRGMEDKIAAIGIRVRKWVTFHGVSINVAPALDHFSGIVPCGIADPRYGVTSLADLGIVASMADVDSALQSSFEDIFASRTSPTFGPA